MNDSTQPVDVAAVDLGSNSFHMLIARANGSDLQVLDRMREPVRLAAGLDLDRRLSPDAQQRALACLERFGQRLKELPPAHVRVVGTNTLREMYRGEDFIAAAEAALGHNIEIIAGVEEARLVFGGVTHGMDEPARKLVIDIGGGSTELIIGQGLTPVLMESVALGCVVHTQRFFESGNITRKNFAKARLAARLELEYLEQAYRYTGWELALGASGTIRGVWRVLMAQGWAEQEITKEGLEKLVELTIKTGNVRKIKFDGLREDRRPVFVGGLAVLAGIFDSLRISRLRTSDRALREGLIYDLLGRIANRDVRETSVLSMAERYSVDRAHAADVAKSAQAIFSQIAESWGLRGKSLPKLLQWAASLHEVGLAISHASYHKHGEYILSHADLPGFSQTDKRLLAALVRLHRGKFASGALDSVPGPWVDTLRRLAIILRLAYLLHRSRLPDQHPEFSLSVNKRSLRMQFSEGWLQQHPLTEADLLRESELLRNIGFELDVESVHG